jgi:hypothetical protein
MIQPHVEEGFDADAVPAPHGVKRTADGERKDAAVDRKARQQQWLRRRSADSSKAALWRPRKLHRRASKKWCMFVDNQFRSVTKRPGLSFFKKDNRILTWTDPFHWPWAGIAMDLGSDGNTGYHGLERHFSLNIDQFNDQSHGVGCDWDLLLNSVQAKSMWVLMAVAWNTPFGPRKGEDLRLHQMRSCLQKLYSENKPRDVPLFMAMAPNMLLALSKMGVTLPGLADPEVELFEWLGQRNIFAKGGQRMSFGRFCAAKKACSVNVPFWAFDDFETTYVCLEFNFLAAKKFRLVVTGEAKAGLDVGEKSGSTSTAIPTVDDHAVRSCAQNGMVIRQLMLSDYSNLRFCGCLDAMGSKLLEWHTLQNRETRNARAAHEWVSGQVNAGYMTHVDGFARCLADSVALEQAGFAVTPSTCLAVSSDMVSEDSFADFMGQSAMTIAFLRTRRNLTLIKGWPKRLLRMCYADEQQVLSVVKEFRVDFEDYMFISSEDVQRTGACEAALARSLFKKTSVNQMVECFKITHWVASPSVQQVAMDHSTGLMQTQIVEDIIGHEKNNKQSQPLLRYRRPVASYMAGLSGKVIQERHQFTPISPDVALLSKGDKLGDAHFYPSRDAQSLPFHDIASFQAQAQFYSPQATYNSVPTADLTMHREYMKRNTMDVYDGA